MEEDGVPQFVKKCVQLIEERGLKSEGIYRVSGKKEDCLTLQEKYDQGNSAIHAKSHMHVIQCVMYVNLGF